MIEDKDGIAFPPSDQKVAHIITNSFLNGMLGGIRMVPQSHFEDNDVENAEPLYSTWHILPSGTATYGWT